MLRIVLFINLVMLPILASGCVTTVNTTEDTNNSPLQTNASAIPATPVVDMENFTQIQENDILIKLSTNKSTYIPGEIILVTASVKNISGNSIEYKLSNIDDPTPYVWLESNLYCSGFALEEKEMGGKRTVIPMVTSGQLKPYSTVTREVIWDQMIFKDKQAPPGTYTIGCGITLGDYQDESTLKTSSTSLNIHIIGALEWITPEQAEKIALSLPEVKSWLEVHSGNNVIKEENGHIFIYLFGEWSKLSPQSETSKSLKALGPDELIKWMPDDYFIHTTFENGKWAIEMGTKYGSSPHFVSVQVDPVTSSVIEIEFSDRSPL